MIASNPPQRAFERTGNVAIDALMQTACLMGATHIELSGSVIACTYQDRRVTYPASPLLTCADVIRILAGDHG